MKCIYTAIFVSLALLKLEAAPENLSFNNENLSFFHGDLGSIGGYPAVGAGYRLRRGHHGFDLSGKSLPTIANEVHALYLLYPMLKEGFYIGAGPGYMSDAEATYHGAAIANAVIGYQKRTKKGFKWFAQLEGSTFVQKHEILSRAYPSITLGIGF